MASGTEIPDLNAVRGEIDARANLPMHNADPDAHGLSDLKAQIDAAATVTLPVLYDRMQAAGPVGTPTIGPAWLNDGDGLTISNGWAGATAAGGIDGVLVLDTGARHALSRRAYHMQIDATAPGSGVRLTWGGIGGTGGTVYTVTRANNGVIGLTGSDGTDYGQNMQPPRIGERLTVSRSGQQVRVLLDGVLMIEATIPGDSVRKTGYGIQVFDGGKVTNYLCADLEAL